MHNSVYDFVCAELKELDEKAKKDKLSLSDIEYADTLEHYKKSVLTNKAMEGEGYSMRGGGRSYDGGSYASDGRRDSRGRFRASYADMSLADELRYRARMEPDEASRRDMERMAERIERGA